MTPDEICVRLGEARYKEMFSALNALQMKQVMSEARVPAVRLPSHTSTRKRNDDWAQRLWRALPTGKDTVGGTLLYQWLSVKRSPMISFYMDALAVRHKNGLTEENFWEGVSAEQAQEAAQRLLSEAQFDKAEAAAYLLFLDFQHKTDKLAPLALEQHLPPQA